MGSVDWALKVAALLHDPADKALRLPYHRQRANDAIQAVLHGLQPQHPQHQSPVDQADRIAAAIDRAAFDERVEVDSRDYLRDPQVKHPFSGAPLLLSGLRQAAAAAKDPEGFVETAWQRALDKLKKLVQELGRCPSPQKRYLALWRALPHLLDDPEMQLLPPDTRIVDHALWNHADATSALTGALDQPAFLHVAIGPVQRFVAEARRTQDLWVGSYILSFLSWAAMKVVAEEYGPDAILYPALRGQPLVDAWLDAEKGVWSAVATVFGLAMGDRTVASLPNKFVALVPADAIAPNGLPRKVKEAVLAAWGEIARAVEAAFEGATDAMWRTIWRRQTEDAGFPEVFWSALEWPQPPGDAQAAEAALNLAKKWLTQPGDAPDAAAARAGCLGQFEEMLDTYRQPRTCRLVNAGTAYGPMHQLLAWALELRKRTRDFGSVEEPGPKCSVVEGLAALHTADKSPREYWRAVAQDTSLSRGFWRDALQPEGRETLSAVAAVKRAAHRFYFEPRKAVDLAFPSTSRVAAAPFYATLLERLGGDNGLQDAVRQHTEALGRLDYPQLSRRAAFKGVPGLGRLGDRVPDGPTRDLAEKLLLYDADVLYPARLAPEVQRQGRGNDDPGAARRAQETCRGLLRAAGRARIPPPSAYYAVVTMDGDHMGQWLAGSHPGMPRLSDVLHPGAQQAVKNLRSLHWDRVLRLSRPLSASLHASLSAALADFSLECVGRVVEGRRLGRVVYAGGDDLLAFVPVRHLLEAMRELRALFSGAATMVLDGASGQVQPHVDWSCDSGFLQTPRGGTMTWRLTPGPHMSLSGGAAIVHHLHPLDAALSAARSALQAAKRDYDRDALCIDVVRRSGEGRRVGTKWRAQLMEGGGAPGDILEFMAQVASHFAEGVVSPRLAFDVATEAGALEGLPREAHAAELRRLLARHAADHDGLDKSWPDKMAGLIGAWQSDGRYRRSGPQALADWLMVARFLAQEGAGG